MKKKFILAILIFLSSCKSFEFKNADHFNKNINNLWGEYFTKSFDQTTNLNVFVVTNRKAKNQNFGCSQKSFGSAYDNKLKFGFCQVNVPKNHDIGEIESASDDSKSLQNYFKITGGKALSQEEMILSLKKSKHYPLIFVHGFNVPYEEAILRASQIVYDLKYQGPIILFTWPAGVLEEGNFFAETVINKTYEENAANARDSVLIFKNFINELQKNNIKANLLIHSMGHQVALPALAKIGEENLKFLPIYKAILNAPDFENEQFKKLLGNIKKTAQQITLYCSYNDKAISASKVFNKTERLGACLATDEIDVINVSAIDDPSFGLGHGYYSSRSILTDVFQNLIGIEASKRLFIKKANNGGKEKYFLRK